MPSSGLFAGATFGVSNLTNGWADRTLAYTSPAFRGFTANAATYLDTDSDHDYGLGIGYRGHGFEGGLQYHDVGGGRTWAQTNGIEDALRGHASYGRGRWSVGTSYENVNAEGGEAQEFLFAAATVEASPELAVSAAVAHVGDGAVPPVQGTGLHAGLFYALYPGARVHVLYSWLDPESGPDRGTLALGLTYHFVLARR